MPPKVLGSHHMSTTYLGISSNSPNFIETSDLLEAASSEVQGAEFIRTFFYLCDEAFCQMTRTGRLLYGDSDHLNAFGSDYFAEQLLKENPDIARVMRDT